jgi:hypothetical protein
MLPCLSIRVHPLPISAWQTAEHNPITAIFPIMQANAVGGTFQRGAGRDRTTEFVPFC